MRPPETKVPKESEWTRDVCAKLISAGGIVVANVMGTMTSHTPDRTITCSRRPKLHGDVGIREAGAKRQGGMFYVEFKGATTKLRAGQQILMYNVNDRWPVAFVYRWPNVLTLETRTHYYAKNVDALKDPRGFLDSLIELHLLALEDATK